MPPRPATTDTRARLVKAAIEVVAKRGFEGASVDAIAKKAGFSIGALYWNFKSKDELFLAVFDEHVTWFERQLAEASDSQSLAAGTAGWIGAVASQSDQFLIFIEFWAYAVRKPRIRQAFARRMNDMREAIASSLRDRAERTGLEPPVDPEFAALIVVALGRGLTLEKLADPGTVDDTQVAEFMAALTA